MAEAFDPRITPARPDLAADFLRGRITAKAYAKARPMQVCACQTPLFGGPDRRAPRQTTLLLGERFNVYDLKDGWAWGQAARDRFVGYVPQDALCLPAAPPEQRISALRTPVFAAPDLKAPVLGFVHHLSCFAVAGRKDSYVCIAPGGGWVFAGHCEAVTARTGDWVTAALLYEHAPYVWGGRTSFGLDCSALVQNALQAGGMAAPRDSDMQEAALGAPVPVTPELAGLHRGDLVFWSGHVGLMLNGTVLLHANAHHMRVAREPLAEAVARIAEGGKKVKSIKRLE